MQKKDKVRTVNSILKEECYGCGSCENKCPVNAIEIKNEETKIIEERCIVTCSFILCSPILFCVGYIADCIVIKSPTHAGIT